MNSCEWTFGGPYQHNQKKHYSSKKSQELMFIFFFLKMNLKSSGLIALRHPGLLYHMHMGLNNSHEKTHFNSKSSGAKYKLILYQLKRTNEGRLRGRCSFSAGCGESYLHQSFPSHTTLKTKRGIAHTNSWERNIIKKHEVSAKFFFTFGSFQSLQRRSQTNIFRSMFVVSFFPMFWYWF
jgi:hypothetical protein